MIFTTINYQGMKVLAFKWRTECDEGCCEMVGVEMRAEINGEYYSLFYPTDLEKDADALIKNTRKPYKGKLKEMFAQWFEMRDSLEDDDCLLDEDDHAFFPYLPFTHPTLQ